MHALIVVSHPDPGSLTHAVAARIAGGLSQANAANTFEVVDLNAEGFDPRFTASDIALHLRKKPAPADVVAEQARIDRSDALVLVYPVYWWSMPALMKGWIDRVFVNGWAYDDVPGAKVAKKLGRLPVHLVGIGGAGAGTYQRRGYGAAMKTQIDHGIFDYCGARVVTSNLLLLPDEQDVGSHLERAQAIGSGLFQSCDTVDAA